MILKDLIVRFGHFVLGARWNSVLAVFVNFYLSHKFLEYYSQMDLSYTGNIKSKTLIYMADGKMRHGGISDRLRGIASVYKLCKKYGFNFKIYFVHPFCLDDFLVPNEYDWRVQSDELIYDRVISKPIVRSTGLPLRWDLQEARMMTKVSGNKNQYHIYTNACFAENEFSLFFSELFKPSYKLQYYIDENLKMIGGDYISISYRFQQLLGDFKDSPAKKMDEKEAVNLIERCIGACRNIHENAPKHTKVLVTSDSTRFLDAVRMLPYVYIIPGIIGHMDYEVTSETHLKTFLDLFLISKAHKAYNVISKEMYNGGFSMRGAMIGGIEYEVLKI